MINLVPTLHKLEKRVLRVGLPSLGVILCLFIIFNDFRRKNEVKEKTKQSLSILLEEPLVNNNLIGIYNIINSFEKTVDSLKICLKDKQDNVIYGDSCSGDFEKLVFRFYNSDFYLNIQIGSWANLAPELAFIFFLILTLLFLGNKLQRVVAIIQKDIDIVSRESDHKLSSFEFSRLNEKIKERESLRNRIKENQKRMEFANEMRLIAHDIRSPLAVVDFLSKDFESQKEKKSDVAASGKSNQWHLRQYSPKKQRTSQLLLLE